MLLAALLTVPIFLLIFSYTWWYQFHPQPITEAVDGPAGPVNRAYFDTNGFMDPTCALYAADWPHTFGQPFYVGDSYRKYGGWGNFYWSVDGSLAVMTYQDDPASLPYFAAAYDYREHRGYELQMHTTELERLVKERGGLGPPVDGYWK